MSGILFFIFANCHPLKETQEQDCSNDHINNNSQDHRYDEVPDSPIYFDIPGSPDCFISGAPAAGNELEVKESDGGRSRLQQQDIHANMEVEMEVAFGNIKTESPAQQKYLKDV